MLRKTPRYTVVGREELCCEKRRPYRKVRDFGVSLGEFEPAYKTRSVDDRSAGHKMGLD